MKIFQYFLLNFFILLTFNLIPMEETGSEMMEIEESGLEPESFEEETEKNLLELLPPEIRLYIIAFLTQAGTISDAIRNINNLRATNRTFKALIDDETNANYLIRLLANRFFKTKGFLGYLHAALLWNSPVSQALFQKAIIEYKEPFSSETLKLNDPVDLYILAIRANQNDIEQLRLAKKNILEKLLFSIAKKKVINNLDLKVISSILRHTDISPNVVEVTSYFDPETPLGMSLLAYAIDNGHISLVKKLIDEHKVDVNKVIYLKDPELPETIETASAFSPLILAENKGNQEIINLLRKAGAQYQAFY